MAGSPFFRLVILPGGVHKKEYIETDTLLVEHKGVILAIRTKDTGIELTWRSLDGFADPVPSICMSYQTMLLTKPEKAVAKPEATPAVRVRRTRAK